MKEDGHDRNFIRGGCVRIPVLLGQLCYMETEKMFKSDFCGSSQLSPLGICSHGEKSQEAALRGWIL